jgi:hypothetical protein
MSHKQMVGAWLGAALALAAVPASAIDAEAFAQRVETAGVGGLTYLGRARAAGEDVIVNNVGVKFGDTTYVFEGQFTFSGIAMQPDGGYVVESITAPEIVLHDTSTRVLTAKVNDFSLTGYEVPGGEGETFPALALHAGLFTWRYFAMRPIGGLSIEIEPTFVNETLSALAVSATVEGMTFDLQDVTGEPNSLVALDVDELPLDYRDSIVWKDSGLVTYTNHTNAGELGASQTEVVVSGLTRDKVEKLIAVQKAGPDILQAATSALIGIVIDDASFRIEAGPLLKEVIDYLANERGDRDAVLAEAEQAGMTVIEALDAPALAALVRPALRAFLAEPSSLEARIDPPAPVTLISLMFAAMAAKTTIVPLLGPTITANEPPPPDAS